MFRKDHRGGPKDGKFKKGGFDKFAKKKPAEKPASTAVVVQPHKHTGIFVQKGKTDALVTKNFKVGESVYGERRIAAELNGERTEFRVWNPFRSKLGATILGGVDNMPIYPGAKVLYLGAASGTTVSHVSDIIGEHGVVYAVEFAHRPGRDLLQLAKRRMNIVPIIADARQPQHYRMLVGLVDTIFADVAQPDQARIVHLNAEMFLKSGGNYMISIKASCVDSTMEPEAVYAKEVDALRKFELKPREQMTLEPFHRGHAVVIGVYKPPTKHA